MLWFYNKNQWTFFSGWKLAEDLYWSQSENLHENWTKNKMKIFACILPDYRSNKSPPAAAPNCASSTPTNLKLFCVCSTYIILCMQKKRGKNAFLWCLRILLVEKDWEHFFFTKSLTIATSQQPKHWKASCSKQDFNLERTHFSCTNRIHKSFKKSSTVGNYCLHWKTTTLTRTSIYNFKEYIYKKTPQVLDNLRDLYPCVQSADRGQTRYLGLLFCQRLRHCPLLHHVNALCVCVSTCVPLLCRNFQAPTRWTSSSSLLAQLLPRSSGSTGSPWPCGVDAISAPRKQPSSVSATSVKPNPGDLGRNREREKKNDDVMILRGVF